LSQKLGYERGIVLAYDKWGDLAAVNSDFYLAFKYYLLADSMLQNMDWPREQAVIYGNLAANYKDLGVFDSATIWNQRFLDIAHELENQDFIAFGLNLQGDIYYNKGQNELAAWNYMEALRIYESTGNQSRLADAHRLLAAAQTAAGSYADAERNLDRAISIYTSIDDLVYLSQSYRDRGNTFFLQGRYPEAEENNRRAAEISEKIEDSWGIGQAHQNLGDIAVVRESYEQAEQYYLDAMERFQNIGSPFEIGLLYTDLAELYLKWGDPARALSENRKAEENLEGLDAYSSLQYLYKNYYEIYAGQEKPQAALEAYQNYVTIKDSLLTVDKQVRIDELQLIYEVEKKDRAIELLSKDLKLDTLRLQLFGVGLVSLALIAGLIIFNLVQRRRKERRIQEERHKRQAAELEKKELARAQLERELAAQVLQLVRKNEMLARVQKEVVQLSKKVEGEPQSDFRRLERSIQTNLQSDEDWKQFLSTFEQVHPAFLQKLRRRATKLSPAEQKLACLLRMNLSSKEIATLLNISDEGVKKGRYRLRKKLDLDSDIGLQEFLLNLPGDRINIAVNQ
jgi:tetratricopeptide (TPR) repeat protein